MGGPKAVSAVTRGRLETQGFVGLDDASLREVGPWLRLAPALCATWAAVGTVFSAPWLLWALVPFAALGALGSGHPFDALYDRVIRHRLGTRPLPPYGAPRRFACAVASVWLAGTGLAFFGGATVVGYALGGAFVLAALVPTLTDFCIPSFIFKHVLRRPAPCAVDDARVGG
jgi:hypothetical protein